MAIIPIYYDIDRETGRPMWGLGPDDFHKVRLGYGCPECLEDFNGVYISTCPVCGHVRDQASDFWDTPDHFQPGVAAPAPEGP